MWMKFLLINSIIEYALLILSFHGNLPDILPDWAFPENWLGPEGHADLKNPADDPSFYNLCSCPLKLFNDGAETVSSPILSYNHRLQITIT